MKKIKTSDINFVNLKDAALPQFYRLGTITNKLDISNSSVYNWEKDGKFPESCDYTDTGTCKAWLASEIDAWALDRIAKRDERIAARNTTRVAANDEEA